MSRASWFDTIEPAPFLASRSYACTQRGCSVTSVATTTTTSPAKEASMRVHVAVLVDRLHELHEHRSTQVSRVLRLRATAVVALMQQSAMRASAPHEQRERCRVTGRTLRAGREAWRHTPTEAWKRNTGASRGKSAAQVFFHQVSTSVMRNCGPLFVTKREKNEKSDLRAGTT